MKWATPAERRKRAEQHARRNGYTGVWPPRRAKRPNTVRDMKQLLRKIEDGDHRATNIGTAGQHVAAFHRALGPDHYYRLACQLICVVLHPDVPDSIPPECRVTFKQSPTLRVRARAVESCITPMQSLDREMARVNGRKAADPKVVKSLNDCIAAFARPFTADVLQRIAAQFTGMGAKATNNAEELVRLAHKTVNMTRGTVIAVSRGYMDVDVKGPARRADGDGDAVADAAFEQMLKRAQERVAREE